MLPCKEFGFGVIDFATPVGYTSKPFGRQLIANKKDGG